MSSTVSPEQRRAAKRQMIEQIEQGASVQQARHHSEVRMHRATVYRLLKRVRTEGEAAYTDGRHGHPIKLRGEVRALLIEMCQGSPSVSSPVVQHAIQARFGLSISVSQLKLCWLLGTSVQKLTGCTSPFFLSRGEYMELLGE